MRKLFRLIQAILLLKFTKNPVRLYFLHRDVSKAREQFSDRDLIHQIDTLSFLLHQALLKNTKKLDVIDVIPYTKLVKKNLWINWVAYSYGNYTYTLALAKELCLEFYKRFNITYTKEPTVDLASKLIAQVNFVVVPFTAPPQTKYSNVQKIDATLNEHRKIYKSTRHHKLDRWTYGKEKQIDEKVS